MNETEYYKNKLINILDTYNKPADVTIATMTITCKINTKFLVENIAKFVMLDLANVTGKKYGKDINETLIKKTKKERKKKVRIASVPDNGSANVPHQQAKKKKKECFYNQITLKVKASDIKVINVKLFINGSLQMTGCNNMTTTIEALEKMFEVLRRPQYVYNKETKQLEQKIMVENPEILHIKNLHTFKIAMINSNFNINFDIDRSKLYTSLRNDKFNCSFDPNLHAAVILKKIIDEKEISIFIFEKGSIVITGATTCMHIKKSYEFINIYLLGHWKNLLKKDKIITGIINDIRAKKIGLSKESEIKSKN